MLYVIRHGQTARNKAKVLQGHYDEPMNQEGFAQARAAYERFAAAGLRFDKVYTSPLQRAIQTAQIVAPGVPQVVDARLIEIDCGPYEGMDLLAPAPEVIAFFRDFRNVPAPEGMESLESIIARIGAFLADVHDEALDANILVSTHGVAMRGALECLEAGSAGNSWSKRIVNCAVFVSEALPAGGWSAPEEW